VMFSSSIKYSLFYLSQVGNKSGSISSVLLNLGYGGVMVEIYGGFIAWWWCVFCMAVTFCITRC